MSSMLIDVLGRIKGTKLGTWYRKRVWNNRILSQKVMNSIIDKFEKNITSEERANIISDMTDMAKRYRFSPEEYYYYHFKNKTEEQRKEFISDLNRIDYCERLNKSKNLSKFDDKLKTYKVFREYFKREVCGVPSKRYKNNFIEFVKSNNKFIIKPLNSCCGQGVRIVDLTDVVDKETAIEQLVKEYKNGGFIAEQLIVQSNEVGKFHPESVNTVRIATVLYDDGVEVLGAFFRTGRGSKVVDNCGAGGVFGTVDSATGEILGVGDELGNTYTAHPDTNEIMLGYILPKWDEAVAMAKELATKVKGNRYAGWDLALTQKGWCLVEANARGQFVWQIPVQKGIMQEINQSLRRLNLAEIKTGI